MSDLGWQIESLADLDGDGKADILWRHGTTGQLFLWLMDGINIIGYQSPGTVSDLNWQIQVVGDFNGDGKADILWRHGTTGQLFLWLMDGINIIGYQSAGHSVRSELADPGTSVISTATAGRTSSGVILTTGQLFVWLMDGINIIGYQLVGTVSDLSWQIQSLVDLDGDGKADILWRNTTSGQLYVWLMNGTDPVGFGSPGTVPDLGWVIKK